MNITRRPLSRYPNTSLLTIVLAISLTVTVGLTTHSKSNITDSIVDLLATCDQCSSAPLSNGTLN